MKGIGVIAEKNEPFEKLFNRFQRTIGKSASPRINTLWNDILTNSHLAKWGKRRKDLKI